MVKCKVCGRMTADGRTLCGLCEARDSLGREIGLPGLAAMVNPREDAEQAALMRWAALQSGKYPELDLLHHIPNGGSRNKAEAGRLKAQGVKKGIPDICLPVARGPFHGLYIEMKRVKGGRVSPEQETILEQLRAGGYCAEVCRGFEAAADLIKRYLEAGPYKIQTGD